MYHIIFIIRLFNLFTSFDFLNNLKLIKAQIIQTILQTNISSGQWTHAIILETHINNTKGKNHQKVFLYSNKYNHVKKAKLTVAWSEGKDASGICFNNNFHTQLITVSGLSIVNNCWIIIEIINAIIVE